MKPTETYNDLLKAFDFFNEKLFDSKLPQTMIVLRKKGKCFGYYHRHQWGERETKNMEPKERTIDEINLNPVMFHVRDDIYILSTLAHEMCHQWQYELGTPSRNGYHNLEWGTKMKEVGLHPSSTGEEGGKETGQNVTHYIIEGGKFEKAFENLKIKIKVEKFDDPIVDKPATNSKVKFTCPKCDCKAWGKSELNISCVDCNETMLPDNLLKELF